MSLVPPLNPLNTGSVSVWRVAIVPIREAGRRRFRVDVVEVIAIYVRMRGDSAWILACARMTNWMAALAPAGGNVACFCVGASRESILKCCWLLAGDKPPRYIFLFRLSGVNAWFAKLQGILGLHPRRV